LPVDATDAASYKANLLVEKITGVSSDGTGLPVTYSGPATTIDPADANIVWNNTAGFWEVTISTTGLGAFFLKTQPQLILPIKWLSVKGSLTNNNTARITWQVDEQQIKNYEIEKSTDGISYSTIGQVASTGNGIHSYSFTEVQTLSGTCYYRIRQTDLDGWFTRSTFIILNNQAGGTIAVYPNPVKNIVTVTTDANLLNTVATLYNVNGTSMQSLTINNTSFTMNLAYYPAGIYFLKTANGKAVKIIRE
jgi:hypothetical protein